MQLFAHYPMMMKNMHYLKLDLLQLNVSKKNMREKERISRTSIYKEMREKRNFILIHIHQTLLYYILQK